MTESIKSEAIQTEAEVNIETFVSVWDGFLAAASAHNHPGGSSPDIDSRRRDLDKARGNLDLGVLIALARKEWDCLRDKLRAIAVAEGYDKPGQVAKAWIVEYEDKVLAFVNGEGERDWAQAFSPVERESLLLWMRHYAEAWGRSDRAHAIAVRLSIERGDSVA